MANLTGRNHMGETVKELALHRKPGDSGSIPLELEKVLQVKVTWGPVALDALQVAENGSVTVGDHPGASIRLSTRTLSGQLYPLVSPGGFRSHVISVVDGMSLEVRKPDGSKEEIRPVCTGAIRSHVLLVGERCRVQMGQISFEIQYNRPARGFHTRLLARTDFRMATWFLLVLVVAFGLWAAIQTNPGKSPELIDSIKSPHRFAIASPFQTTSPQREFETIQEKIIKNVKVNEPAKWKRSTGIRGKGSVPRANKERVDREMATEAGIIRLLRERGGGPGGDSGTIFGGSKLASLDHMLDGIPSSGYSNPGGFGGLRPGGGHPGAGGDGLAPGGTPGYGEDNEFGILPISTRGAVSAEVKRPKKPPTRVIGGLTQQVVGEYIGRYWSQFKYCYEKGLASDPNLYGKITVTFGINAVGRVHDASVMQTSLQDNNVEQCLLRVVRRIRFPKPKGGGEVVVTYPFLFTTAG
jgi:TonB family protein